MQKIQATKQRDKLENRQKKCYINDVLMKTKLDLVLKHAEVGFGGVVTL